MASVIFSELCSSIAFTAFGVGFRPNAFRDASTISATVPLTTAAAMLVPLMRRVGLPL